MCEGRSGCVKEGKDVRGKVGWSSMYFLHLNNYLLEVYLPFMSVGFSR